MKVDGDNLVPLGKSHSAFTMIGVKSEAELQCIHISVNLSFQYANCFKGT